MLRRLWLGCLVLGSIVTSLPAEIGATPEKFERSPFARTYQLQEQSYQAEGKAYLGITNLLAVLFLNSDGVVTKQRMKWLAAPPDRELVMLTFIAFCLEATGTPDEKSNPDRNLLLDKMNENLWDSGEFRFKSFLIGIGSIEAGTGMVFEVSLVNPMPEPH